MQEICAVLDTETTGWSPKKGDRVIEVAASRFDLRTGELLNERFHTYVNPGFPIEAQATAIHGITNEMLAGKPAFAEISEELEAFVRGTHLVIHNSAFDVGFLNAEFEAVGRTKFETLPLKVTCTRRIARHVLPPAQSARLDDLCDLFGIDRSIRTLHGALVDCSLLAQVYPHLARLQAKQDEVLNSLLPFARGVELPQDKDALGRGYTVLNQLINRLKSEQDRIKEVLAPMLNKQDYEHRDFNVTFGESTTTAWEKVVAEHLKGVDLSPYQKKKPTMTIKAA